MSLEDALYAYPVTQVANEANWSTLITLHIKVFNVKSNRLHFLYRAIVNCLKVVCFEVSIIDVRQVVRDNKSFIVSIGS